MRPLGTPTPTLLELNDNRFERSIVHRARDLQCTVPPPDAFRSRTNNDDGRIDFSQSEFLGVPNPMEFPVTDTVWEVRNLSL